MDTKLNSEYFQLLSLIRQLPQDKLEKLVNTLQSELNLKKTSSQSRLKQLILNAPTWTDEELAAFQQARNHINSSRLANYE